MRKFLWLAPALLLASCHGAQVALQPQAATSEPITAAPAAVPIDSALTATVVVPRPAAVAAGPAAMQPAPAAQPIARAQKPSKTRLLSPLASLAKATIAAPVAKRLAHRWQRQRPTEGAAENGLGRVALFFIGVVLAVLVGLAALVNLIFSVGFFTALGYTAAGLVVLFLLYSLFSGGKKKK
jgi:hypothetical protein